MRRSRSVWREAGVSRQTVDNWCRRADVNVPDALHDRASTPHHSPQRLVRSGAARSRSRSNNPRSMHSDVTASANDQREVQ